MVVHSVDFIVGNTYQKLPHSKAKYDNKSGRHLKVHDWTLFLDVINGDPDIIERVTFNLGSSFTPSTYVCASPVLITRPNGTKAWRFKTRQQTFASITATLSIRGCGGSLQEIKHAITFDDTENNHSCQRQKSSTQQFVEKRPLRVMKPLKIDEKQNFGVELELTSAPNVTVDMIAGYINENSSIYIDVKSDYSQGRAKSSNWKIVPDSSIVCNRSIPDCHKFEIVSPILTSGHGLSQINTLLRQLDIIQPKLKVNKSMGYHVHIDVHTLSHKQLVKVCQNFIKYEDVMDTFMPLSRRTGSLESNQYFKSNRFSVITSKGVRSNRMCHDALEQTSSLEELVNIMNYNDDRYYKLNLQNLKSGRQPTIEFRQHSATINYDKISCWIRFCVAFVTNSAKLPSPSPFDEKRDVNYKVDKLFQWVIKDRALRDFYLERRELLSRESEHDGGDDGQCCSCCASGDRCASASAKRYKVGE